MAAVQHFIKWPNEKSRLLSALRCAAMWTMEPRQKSPEFSSEQQQQLPPSAAGACQGVGRTGAGPGRGVAGSIFAARIKFG